MAQEAIYVKLLGGLFYRSGSEEEWKPLDESLPGGTGKKLRSFLEYLIIHHRREIPAAELIELFWSDSGEGAPGNALKYMMHKARILLKAMFQAHENLILTHRGGYAWDKSVPFVLDAERFEQLCRSDKVGLSPQNLPYMLEAIQLYEGDLLPGNEDDWVRPLRTYYHTLYISICKNALILLSEENLWAEVASICERAYMLDPSIEEFTLYFMQALLALEQPERALEHYETFRQMLWQDFGLIPPEQVEIQRAIATEIRGGHSLSNQEIFNLVTEESDDLGAFLCNFSVFRSLVHLEKRHCIREKRTSSVVIVRLFSRKDEEGGPVAVSSTDARRLERVLLSKLRTGDPIARLHMGAFLVLLSGASAQDTHTVMERIGTQFRKAYPRSKARLSYQVFPLPQ